MITIWFLLIFAADITTTGVVALYKYLKNKPLDFNCDSCDEPEKLRQTPDRKFYFCKKCMEAYLTEELQKNPEAFSEEELRRARKWYRRMKRRKK